MYIYKYIYTHTHYIYIYIYIHIHIYRTSLVAQMVKYLPTKRETWVLSLGQEDPLEKCSCLENPMDRVVCYATVHGVTESDTTSYIYVYNQKYNQLTNRFQLWSNKNKKYLGHSFKALQHRILVWANPRFIFKWFPLTIPYY